uniref:DC-STAMP domain containing 1 n=1 Tax=Oncorhynchus kisutch TaxID=8019 RepID=A0A8C7FU28_ONCKI
MASLLQVVSLAVFVCVLLAVDMVLHHIFDIIRRHTFTKFSLTSSHHIDINVGGQSMMAKLLRKTIGAFNTSSNLDMQSSNQHCLPQPRALTKEDYLWSFVPLLMMALMCCLQVYSNRLRRVIAAFYFPKVRPHTPTLNHTYHPLGLYLQTEILISTPTDNPASEGAGCGCPGLAWLHVVCGCETGWTFCQII